MHLIILNNLTGERITLDGVKEVIERSNYWVVKTDYQFGTSVYHKGTYVVLDTVGTRVVA